MLTFTNSGQVSDHLVLHPTLTSGNFIIKPIWLPGTQTELAIVTADFVKVSREQSSIELDKLICFKGNCP